MALVESGPEIAVFEGELVFDDGDEGNEAREEFEEALEGLRRSGVRIPTVDLARVTAVSAKPAGLLFAMWLDLIREGRAFVLLAQDHVWEMLGRAAVESLGPQPSKALRSRAASDLRAERPRRSRSSTKENRDAAARIAR